MNTYCEQTITKKATKPLQFISSLGFVMPFQPSMWDDKSIQSALDYTTHIIETKLKISYSDECTNTMLGRIKQLFDRLNFNTHRKSIAVLISADSEKVMYLNFPVKLFVSTRSFISVLDLVTSIKQQPGFYLLFNSKDNLMLFEYCNKQLNKVYEQKPDAVSGYFVDGAIRASSVITYMNTNYQKPVFIVGSREDVSSFQSTVSYPEIIFQVINTPVQYSAEMMQTIVTEIVEQWSHWLSKFQVRRIAMAKKGNTLIFKYSAVLQALCNSADGLMLMDKRVKKELQKPATGDILFMDSKFFISQIEKFVDRGNCIVIKENALLRDWGGIVLLPCTTSCHQDKHSYGGYRIAGGTGNLF